MLYGCVVLLLLGISVTVVWADDCNCTPDYDDTAATADTDCKALATYVGCIEDHNKTTPCTPKSANLPRLKVEKKCSAPTAICICEITYWGTDLTASGEPCKALANYTKCLGSKTSNGCGATTVADLKKNVDYLLVKNKCKPNGNGEVITPKSEPLSTSTEKPSDNGARLLETNLLIVMLLLSVSSKLGV